MKIPSGFVKSFVASFLVLSAWSATAAPDPLSLYKARATLVGYLKTDTGSGESLTPFQLNTRGLTNLALGLPIKQAVPTGMVLAVAADYGQTVSGEANSTKELLVVDTTNNSKVMATIVISDNPSVFNAQTTVHTFKRFGFGAGVVQVTGNTDVGTTGGRVQLLGVLHRKQTLNGPTPILTLSMVGSMDVYLGSVARTFYISSGVVTASGAAIGQFTPE